MGTCCLWVWGEVGDRVSVDFLPTSSHTRSSKLRSPGSTDSRSSEKVIKLREHLLDFDIICFLSCLVLDIRKLYYLAGVENKPTVFLFNDTQVVEESFLEDINNILSSGEVPNLYKPDEFEEVRTYIIQATVEHTVKTAYVY